MYDKSTPRNDPCCFMPTSSKPTMILRFEYTALYLWTDNVILRQILYIWKTETFFKKGKKKKLGIPTYEVIFHHPICRLHHLQ